MKRTFGIPLGGIPRVAAAAEQSLGAANAFRPAYATPGVHHSRVVGGAGVGGGRWQKRSRCQEIE